ncbi:MAG: hypothetical protein Q8P15_00820 [Nanoarchaeota archaeon]|nr:hypothetical protein [Nanoarchaeota archaeon]
MTNEFYKQKLEEIDLKNIKDLNKLPELPTNQGDSPKNGNNGLVLYDGICFDDIGQFMAVEKNENIIRRRVEEIVGTFFDYFNSGASYLRVLAAWEKISSVLNEKTACYFPSNFHNHSFRTINHYIERMSEQNDSRNFDIGDKVKFVSNSTRYYPNYQEVVDEIRNKAFPFGSIGHVIDINNFNRLKVRFNYIKGFPDINGFLKDKGNPEEFKRIIKEMADIENKTGRYSIKELQFVPLNYIEIESLRKMHEYAGKYCS